MGKPPRAAGPGLLDRVLRWQELSILVVAIILVAYFEWANRDFLLTDASLQNLSQFVAPAAIIACGEIMLMIGGEIDLSAGMVFALAPFVMHFAHQAGVPLLLAVLLAVLASGVVGLVNGVITVALRVPSFITTLGTNFLLNGLTLTLSHGTPVEAPEQPVFAAVFGAWGYSEIIWAVGIVAIMHTVLRGTRWGLHTIAAGANPIGASEAGIRVSRLKIGNFVIAAALAGLTGILEGFRISSIDPQAGGNAVMFLAVAAGVIGGTPLAGGSGTIVGGLIGALRPRRVERRVHADRHQRVHLQHHSRRRHPGRDAVQHPRRPPAPHGGRMNAVPPPAAPEAVRAEGIVKRFGAVTALSGVSLHLAQGEILGILGDNGAGKSTLLKILTGYQPPTEGKLFVNGTEVALRSVDHARALGIECVYQDLALANSLSVYHNLFLNREILYPGPFRLLNNRAMRRQAEACLEQIGVHIPSVTLPVERLSGGQRQAIAVARAVNSNARVLLLDEPLAAMGAREAGLIIDLILRLKAAGSLSIIMIMHNYAQTLEIADRIMLMQRGTVTYENHARSTSVSELMEIVRREYRTLRA